MHSYSKRKINQRQQKAKSVNKDSSTAEVRDTDATLETKCQQLANSLKEAAHPVVYTGAGISTAANIPDYRGPQGVWTQLQCGKLPERIEVCDAEPTLTHMSLVKLHQEGYVKHVTSQNCDGLHLRSGYPRKALSEIHGNMYIEVCKSCSVLREYVRLFDVTEKSSYRRHATSRSCHACGATLQDTIIHFGEASNRPEPPWNWEGAGNSTLASPDVILCLGSSLKILKHYKCLWMMHKPLQQRPQLYIVNLQWTPKDKNAVLKINGDCDRVMELVMKYLALDIPQYCRSLDPLFELAVPLTDYEEGKCCRKQLARNSDDTTMPEDCSGTNVKRDLQKSNASTSTSSNVGWFGRGLKCTLKHTKRRRKRKK